MECQHLCFVTHAVSAHRVSIAYLCSVDEGGGITYYGRQ